ncbi:AraC family transcriptional regulator [Aquimarina sp. RZ0]|uniref:helix-turn-helix domain-containing protein n=1 Tax=Aquimarina sp. RZ0 TaxID=2607730 RepID=UPI0011F0B78F|nr:helix-turn-helix domain-containing protein [Aquimarina sp. RZ0]KAA1244227.1 AraC family transcriptional regulator [Aquimarina sp. RZ0]
MQSIQQVIDQIPIRHNLVSYGISLGIFLGVLLSLVILIRASKKSNAFKVYGWSLLIQSIIAMDIFLCYTGLIKYIPHLNDSTEPLVLLLAPSIYLFVQSLLEQTAITIKKHWIHIVIPIAYFISQLKFYFQPKSVKINAYLGAYHPKISSIQLPDDFDYSYHWIKDELRWLILGSFIFYIILSIRLIAKHQAKKKVVNAENIRLNKFNFSKNTALGFLAFFILVFIVFVNFDNDGGDHYIFIFHTILVCITSFVLLSESRFFENSWLADKYETSKIKDNPIFIEEIETYVETKQYYLQESASLKDLAKALNTHPNYISQTINASTHQNFNDFINQYRIEISKKRLLDKEYKHLTIEAIAHSVGFKSKATFYNAFKKHVAVSPGAFIKLHK